MKKVIRLFFLATILTFFTVIITSCNSNINSPTNENDVSNVSFDEISRMAYIGGSLVYNPGNIGYGQIYNGAQIAIRTSELESDYQTVTFYEETNETNDTLQEYSDNIDTIKFGYLTITAVSKERISFTYTEYKSDGNVAGTSNYTIKAGDEVDISGDKKPDLKYSPLVPARNDFEEAMVLSFISSMNDLYTTMYATIKTNNPSRAAIETSLYGLNSNGEFIYIVGIVDSDSRAITSSDEIPGISHGDYVIAESTGEYFTAVGNDSYAGYSLKSIDDYVETENENELFAELEPFLTYFYTDEQFASDNGAVALLKKMPETLWEELSDKIKKGTCTQDEAIVRLNEILLDLSSIYIIIDENKSVSISQSERNDFEEAQKDFILSLFPGISEDALDDEEKFEKYLEENDQNYEDLVYVTNVSTKYLTLVAMSRRFIEKYFPESPRAIAEVPDVTLVFPLLSMDLGDAPEPDEIKDLPDTSSYNSSDARNVYSVDSRSAERTYQAYLDKKEKIEKDFSKFHSMSLSKISIKNATDDKDKDNNDNKQDDKTETNDNDTKDGKNDKVKENVYFMKQLNTELKLGVIGSLDIRWGKVNCNLAGAVYFSIDANLSNLNYYNTIFKKDFVDIHNPPLMVGPIPITLSLKGDFKLDLNIVASSKINCALGYTGMFGAGVNFGANYGVAMRRKWFLLIPYSYFDPYFEPYTINNTAFYAGKEDYKQGALKSADKYYIEFIPKITIKPGISIGFKYVFAGLEIPMEFRAQPGFGLFASSYLSDARNDWWCIGPNLFDDMYFCDRLILGGNLSICPVIGVIIPVINKKVETNWKAKTLFDFQCALTDDGFKYKMKY